MADEQIEIYQIPTTKHQLVLVNQCLTYALAAAAGDFFVQLRVIQSIRQHIVTMGNEEISTLNDNVVKLARAAFPDVDVETL